MVIDQFSKRAETYSVSANWISDPSLIQAHLEAAGRMPPGHVIELCCGTGMVGRNYQTAGWSVCGLDLTREMVLEANRFFPCICASAEDVPFLDNAFDVAVLRQAYFLLENGQKILAQTHRILKDDGVFVLGQTVPYSPEDAPWLERVHRTKQAALCHFFTEEGLAAELEREYFRITHVRRLTVRENITRWMEAAPELPEERRQEVCGLIAGAPEPYRSLHRVEVTNGQIFEDWNWVVFTARKRTDRGNAR